MTFFKKKSYYFRCGNVIHQREAAFSVLPCSQGIVPQYQLHPSDLLQSPFLSLGISLPVAVLLHQFLCWFFLTPMFLCCFLSLRASLVMWIMPCAPSSTITRSGSSLGACLSSTTFPRDTQWTRGKDIHSGLVNRPGINRDMNSCLSSAWEIKP